MQNQFKSPSLVYPRRFRNGMVSLFESGGLFVKKSERKILLLAEYFKQDSLLLKKNEKTEARPCVSRNSRKRFGPEKLFYVQTIYKQRFNFRSV